MFKALGLSWQWRDFFLKAAAALCLICLALFFSLPKLFAKAAELDAGAPLTALEKETLLQGSRALKEKQEKSNPPLVGYARVETVTALASSPPEKSTEALGKRLLLLKTVHHRSAAAPRRRKHKELQLYLSRQQRVLIFPVFNERSYARAQKFLLTNYRLHLRPLEKTLLSLKEIDLEKLPITLRYENTPTVASRSVLAHPALLSDAFSTEGRLASRAFHTIAFQLQLGSERFLNGSFKFAAPLLAPPVPRLLFFTPDHLFALTVEYQFLAADGVHKKLAQRLLFFNPLEVVKNPTLRLREERDFLPSEDQKKLPFLTEDWKIMQQTATGHWQPQLLKTVVYYQDGKRKVSFESPALVSAGLNFIF